MKLWKLNGEAKRSKSLDSCDRCGVWPFATGTWDPFLKCCLKHDAAYVAHDNGDTTPKQVIDQMFLACCLGRANQESGIKKLMFKGWAWAYYGLVRSPIAQWVWDQ